jgi:hypothetical protein
MIDKKININYKNLNNIINMLFKENKIKIMKKNLMNLLEI